MKFYPEQLFHIYNQGNNRQKIFFSNENYLYFLWKMTAYLKPFGELISWCLMPNHFHWQFFVKKVEIKRKELRAHVDEIEMNRRKMKYGSKAYPINKSYFRKTPENDLVTLNEAIGTIEKSYTQAINREKGWTGSLFRQKCKAKDCWIDEFITLKNTTGKLDSRFLPGTDYAYQCFCYIHNNPVEADLVQQAVDWNYSSARDYAGLRNGSLCNLKMGRELMNYI